MKKQKDTINQENKENSKELIPKNNKKTKQNIFHKFANLIENKLLTDVIGTILLVVIIVDIYLGVNLILNKFILPEFDLTENKIYSLSDETKTKLGNLEPEVKITFINYDDQDPTIKLAEKYIVLNNKISIEKIDDITSRKDLMEKYSLDTSSSEIIISSGEKDTILSEYDLYTYDYSTYETIDTTEEALTNAIVEVTTENKPKIYFMANHAEYQIDRYFATLISSMKEDANEVETLDILSAGSVPEDCNTLVITTLSEDITEFERDKILEYINRGGEILILNGSSIQKKDLSNYEQILQQYGITIEEGIIFEGNASNMLYGYPDFIVEKMQNNSLTQKLNMNLSLCLADAVSIIFDQDKAEELNVEYEELLYTSDKAFRRVDTNLNVASRTDSDSEESELTIAALANKKIDDKNNSKLIIFGNELFVSDMSIKLNGYENYIVDLYNNEDAVLNSIAFLNEREDTITIRKSYDTVNYTATELQHNIIMAIIFITPLIIIILGIIVWQYRRRKR